MEMSDASEWMCEYMCFTIVNSSVMSMCICENKLAMVPAPWSLKKKKNKQTNKQKKVYSTSII